MRIPHKGPLSSERRFRFGRNWRRYLSVVSEDRIEIARKSILERPGVASLAGKTFLDAGCGSGLFSLAAVRSGALVTSFDYDPESVECAVELRKRAPEAEGRWKILQGSVLDRAFLETLGKFDVVYSWGVLHHTGAMWDAIAAIVERVSPGGILFVSIYNDQGYRSAVWRRVKWMYCQGMAGRLGVLAVFVPYFVVKNVLFDVARGRNPWNRYADYRRERGMSVWHDWVDWLGGFPFEVASAGEVFSFISERGFRLVHLRTTSSIGCNEFVFERERKPLCSNGIEGPLGPEGSE
jgi:2-polyprenyl-3-methyl-5-hydroxy-6-metoxy-1,4-benzoquinol methylase